jgi:hypothetical protein
VHNFQPLFVLVVIIEKEKTKHGKMSHSICNICIHINTKSKGEEEAPHLPMSTMKLDSEG